MPHLLRLLGVGMVTLVGLSWPLWTGMSPLPQVPWFSVLCRVPVWCDWVLLSVAGVFAMALVSFPRTVLSRRWIRVAGLAGWGLLLSLDQLRVQPWAWEFFLVLLLLAVCRIDDVPTGWRWLIISIYFWSAISKLDRGFMDGHGQLLLGGMLKAVGGSAEFWPEWQRQIAALAMPAGELSVALLLAWPRMRIWGWLGSVVMHALLLLTVGPLGLNHEPGVLAWNVFFIVQNTLLFASPGLNRPDSSPESSARARRPTLPSVGLITLIAAAPMLELFGHYDHWPAWAVYCARPEKVQLSVSEELVERLPPTLQGHVRRPEPLDEFRPVNLDGWVFSEVHCPSYPQGRYRLAMAAAVLQSADAEDAEFGIEIGSSPDRLSGERHIARINGRKDLRNQLDGYLINTRSR